MKTEYKTDLEKNYLILKPEKPEDPFSVQMLLENQIEGLLRFERRVFNGEAEYFYDITGKHSLESQIKKKLLGESTVRTLLQSIYHVEGELYSYFLEAGGLLLKASYIYADEKGFCFGYNPAAEKKEEKENLEEFVLELQEMIDYEEEGAMQLTFRLYQMIKESEKGILQILEEVLTEKSGPEEDREDDSKSEEPVYLQEPEEQTEERRQGIYTAFLFFVSFLVSLCYLIMILLSENWVNITGMTACILAVISLFGISTAFINIDSRRKK